MLPMVNRCHLVNRCHPSVELGRVQTGATSQLVPPVIPTWVVGELVPPLGPNGRTGAIRQSNSGRFQTGATRQLTRHLTLGERQAGATRASESVPPVSQARAENGKGATPLFTGGNASLLWGSFLVARRPRGALVWPRCALIRQRNTLLGLFF